MPHPNQFDQPAEGGPEIVERALQKQSEPKPASKSGNAAERDRKPRKDKADKQR